MAELSDKARYLKAFANADKHGNGVLSKRKVEICLRHAGVPRAQAHVSILFEYPICLDEYAECYFVYQSQA